MVYQFIFSHPAWKWFMRHVEMSFLVPRWDSNLNSIYSLVRQNVNTSFAKEMARGVEVPSLIACLLRYFFSKTLQWWIAIQEKDVKNMRVSYIYIPWNLNFGKYLIKFLLEKGGGHNTPDRRDTTGCNASVSSRLMCCAAQDGIMSNVHAYTYSIYSE